MKELIQLEQSAVVVVGGGSGGLICQGGQRGCGVAEVQKVIRSQWAALRDKEGSGCQGVQLITGEGARGRGKGGKGTSTAVTRGSDGGAPAGLQLRVSQALSSCCSV